jgi:hypothetical protein
MDNGLRFCSLCGLTKIMDGKCAKEWLDDDTTAIVCPLYVPPEGYEEEEA